LLGATLGGFTAWAILDMATAPSVPVEDVSWVFRDMFGEFFGTFVFVYIVLIMAHK